MMNKYILIVLSFILVGCGARKVDVNKSIVKKDSVVETKVEVKTEITKLVNDSTNAKTEVCEDELILTPIDTTKEMVVNGKHYKNVVLRHKKTKTNSLYTNNKRESETKHKDSVATTKAAVKSSANIKIKHTDKSADYSWFIWLILIIIIIYTLWRNRLWIIKKL